MKVAAIQLTSTHDVDANLKQVENWINELSLQSVDLVVLPENFACFGPRSQILQFAKEESFGLQPVRQRLSHLAKQHNVWIVAGTLPLLELFHDSSPLKKDRVFTSSLVFDHLGREIARYDKIHLFDVDVDDGHARYRESDTYCSGFQKVVTQTPVGRLGLSICYDLRFPELYRSLLAYQVDLLSVPAAFTARTGEAHWQVLLRARAIENQCYVIAANQTGFHSAKRETYGHSQIIDPWGNVLSELGVECGYVVAEIDLSYLQTLRNKMPALDHRRVNKI